MSQLNSLEHWITYLAHKDMYCTRKRWALIREILQALPTYVVVNISVHAHIDYAWALLYVARPICGCYLCLWIVSTSSFEQGLLISLGKKHTECTLLTMNLTIPHAMTWQEFKFDKGGVELLGLWRPEPTGYNVAWIFVHSTNTHTHTPYIE